MNCLSCGTELPGEAKFCSKCGKPQGDNISYGKEKKIYTRLIQGLKGPFDLSGERKSEAQYFHMETQFIHLGFDGKRNRHRNLHSKAALRSSIPFGKRRR